MGSCICELKGVFKAYSTNAGHRDVLHNLDLTIYKGEFISITGKSGSGKTTLLNLLGLMDRFQSGDYLFDGESIMNYDEDRKSSFRNLNIGFVFQQFNLIDSLDIFKNVELPLIYRKNMKRAERKAMVEDRLEELGIADKIYSRPFELSGGQLQRAAIARALVTEPQVILADEPTGSLDTQTGDEIMKVFVELNKKGKTIVMVTHDKDMTRYTSRNILLKDGGVIIARRL